MLILKTSVVKWPGVNGLTGVLCMDRSIIFLILAFIKEIPGDKWNKAEKEKLKWHHIFLYLQHKTDNEYSYIYKSYYANEVNTIDVSKNV